MTTNLNHQASTFTIVKDIVTSNITADLFAIIGKNRDLNAHIPIVVFDHICYICACVPNLEASDINHKAILCPHRYSHRQLPPINPKTIDAYCQPQPLSLYYWLHISGFSTLAYLGNWLLTVRLCITQFLMCMCNSGIFHVTVYSDETTCTELSSWQPCQE